MNISVSNQPVALTQLISAVVLIVALFLPIDAGVQAAIVLVVSFAAGTFVHQKVTPTVNIPTPEPPPETGGTP